ncbi:hypothetical protein EYF80_012474 [Liparis tanakae]|uniref:Uncharacterized protein n=1 Tax=Liparis tanakae TaxID=230148 RepID=A0A4Z2IHC5_9TELE|nr:hypothetical protein EYF80_012474 [Liparis tanakae]
MLGEQIEDLARLSVGRREGEVCFQFSGASSPPILLVESLAVISYLGQSLQTGPPARYLYTPLYERKFALIGLRDNMAHRKRKVSRRG